MTIRKFIREELDSEPHDVRFKDVFPWDAIAKTPFGASVAIVEPGGRTMLHSHAPAETFVICRGSGTMTIDERSTKVGAGDVIYNPPHSLHDLRNDSTTEDLMFVSVFWDPPQGAARESSQAPRLIVPSPPTANGPLHLGHLSGPYLIADVLRRYYRARGVAATFVCVVDEHQSYVLDRALTEGTTADALATKYATEILATLEQFAAKPDVVIRPTQDATYRESVRERLVALHAAGKLEARETETWFCATCNLELYDSFVVGACPHCRARSYGFICESCAAINAATDLIDARCDRCQQPPELRKTTRLYLPLATYREALVDYHQQLRLTPKLRRFAAQWLARLDAVPATQTSTWGIPVGLPGFDGQVISPWLEVALAGPHVRERVGGDAEMIVAFGYDNAFLYLIHDPAVALAIDPHAKLPSALVANEFLMLDDAKMSTSRSHALRAADVLARVPADLVRLYLAKMRPEDAATSANAMQAQMFLGVITQYWQTWLARLGEDLAKEMDGKAPAAANPSLAPWSAEQTAFLDQLKSLLARAKQGYEAASLKEVMFVVHELVDRAVAFGAAQRHLANVPSLANQRATGLALELAALCTFAMIIAPIMPTFGQRLWQCLGYSTAVEWSDVVDPVTPGQAIHTTALASRAFFPAPITLG